MRELKFRAWYAPEMISKKGLFMWSDKFPFSGEMLSIAQADLLCLGPGSVVIQQYTGLKDKYGKEIYEGDLIAEIDKIEELEKWGTPLKVEFGQYSDNEDSWGFSSGTTGFLLRYSDGSMNGLHTYKEGHYGFHPDEIMIVGNIFENPELLK